MGGRTVWNLRYADDTALLAKTKAELEEMGEALAKHSAEFGLNINSTKTVAMVWTNTISGRLVLGGEEMKKVERYIQVLGIDGNSGR